MPDTKGSVPISTRRRRIAELARRYSTVSTVSHHIDIDWMREAWRLTRKDGAVGVDEQTAEMFAEHLDSNLGELLEGLKSGRYRAPPVRRVEIPKGRGKTRPIGIPTLSDKVLQRCVHMALEPIYEETFTDFSYGFRPGRSAHQALERLDKELWRMQGGWVIDADISSFFDTLDHGLLRGILRQRVSDGVLMRAVGKWLNAGVMDEGQVHRTVRGTPQGGVVSPLLANIYLHEVLDRWWLDAVVPRLRGTATIVRYADDFVMAFRYREDAERVLAVLSKRFERYGLQLHPEKTRLVRFERPSRGSPKPETFDFLGFTHYWGRSRKGKPALKRKTATGRQTRFLTDVGAWMKRHRHLPVPVQREILNRKLRGHYAYYGITGNSAALGAVYEQVKRRWRTWLGRRSQRGYLSWNRYVPLLQRHPLMRPVALRSKLRRSANP